MQSTRIRPRCCNVAAASANTGRAYSLGVAGPVRPARSGAIHPSLLLSSPLLLLSPPAAVTSPAVARRAALGCSLSALLSFAVSPVLAQGPTPSAVAPLSSIKATLLESFTRQQDALAELDAEEEDVKTRDPLILTLAVVLETFGLVGAIAGGLVARKRGFELKALLAKLRVVNKQLRATARKTTAAALLEERTAKESSLNATLRSARELLDQDAAAAAKSFTAALALGRAEGNQQGVRKALRGCAAAKERLGDLSGALADLEEVLAISKTLGELPSEVETLGKLADLLTDTGDYDQAGRYYDQYLAAEKRTL